MTSKDTERVLMGQMVQLGRRDLAERIEQGDSAAVTEAMEARSRAARRERVGRTEWVEEV